jgi:hypothetical protein
MALFFTKKIKGWVKKGISAKMNVAVVLLNLSHSHFLSCAESKR